MPSLSTPQALACLPLMPEGIGPFDGTKGGSGFGLEVIASLVAYAIGAEPRGTQH
jgi:hypothetical protein